jgi:hypothetical protein
MDDTQIEESTDEQPPGKQIISPLISRIDSKFPITNDENSNPVDLINLRVRIETNIHACELLWNQFSPNQSLFDLWDFRYAFWKGYKHKPHFYCLENNYGIQAVLPLWYEKKDNQFSWFGSYWQEDNKFFIKHPSLIPMLLQLAPSNTTLNAISPYFLGESLENINFIKDDPKYTLSIDGWNSIDTMLVSLNKKHRYNLKRDYRLISELSPEIIIDEYNDFDILRKLSTRRFKQFGNNFSAWACPNRVKTFKAIIDIGRSCTSFSTRMITVKIGGVVAGVDLVALYNGCYYPLVCGYNVNLFSGIGNYFTWIEIEDAIKLGMKKIDVLEGNYGWKDKWFTTSPLLKYTKQ